MPYGAGLPIADWANATNSLSRMLQRSPGTLAFSGQPRYHPADPFNGVGQVFGPALHFDRRTPMADQFDAFQKEVEEDLQRERMQKFWQQYSTYILAGAAAIVLGVAGWKYLEARKIAAAEANGRQFTEAVRALAAGKGPEDQAKMAAMAADASGYGLLARLRLAADDATAGRTDKALAAYEAIATQTGIDRQIADYARLQTAMLKVDTAEWTDIQNRVIDLAGDASPWRHGAREVLGLAAFRAGKLPEARAQFEKLVADPSTPRSISERAGIVLGEIVQGELAKLQPAVSAQPAKAPVETKPAEAKPAETKPAETKPAATEPAGKKKK